MWVSLSQGIGATTFVGNAFGEPLVSNGAALDKNKKRKNEVIMKWKEVTEAEGDDYARGNESAKKVGGAKAPAVVKIGGVKKRNLKLKGVREGKA